jgi:MFS family permease
MATIYGPGRRWGFLLILFLVGTSASLDRVIISVLLEPIKVEFGASDTMLGLLSGASFALLYAVLGVPVARWADVGDRKLIITLALGTWSLMTALCGTAQTFWQLALARVGVGIGEAGAVPPSQSLLVDYFPPEQRALALSVSTASGVSGYLLGFAGGAAIAASMGWRWAFILVGLPGLALAALAYFGLHEPRTVSGFPDRCATREGFFDSLRVLWQRPTYRYLLLGLMAWSFFAYGALVFVPSYLVRVLHLDLASVGTAYGLVSAASALVGTLGGGLLADKLAARDRRWLLRMPAIGTIAALPCYLLSFTTDSFFVFLIASGLASTLVLGALPTIFAASHAVCGSARRAVSVAIMLFATSLIGATAGPLATGVVSDLLRPDFGDHALRWSLVLMTMSMPVAAWLLARGSSTLRQDEET